MGFWVQGLGLGQELGVNEGLGFMGFWVFGFRV